MSVHRSSRTTDGPRNAAARALWRATALATSASTGAARNVDQVDG